MEINSLYTERLTLIPHLHVKTIKADYLIDNYSSIRILTKAGMKEVSRDDELIYWRS